MDSKLTLKLEKKTIEKAKQYALSNNISLSKLIENYLKYLTTTKKEYNNSTSLVDSLSGVLKVKKNFNEKKEYKQYLETKYKL